MRKKKPTPHLDFYNQYKRRYMPVNGLCSAAINGKISLDLLNLFKPTKKELIKSGHHIAESGKIRNSHWGSEHKKLRRTYVFTPFRQTVVLFMAAMNDEL